MSTKGVKTGKRKNREQFVVANEHVQQLSAAASLNDKQSGGKRKYQEENSSRALISHAQAAKRRETPNFPQPFLDRLDELGLSTADVLRLTSTSKKDELARDFIIKEKSIVNLNKMTDDEAEQFVAQYRPRKIFFTVSSREDVQSRRFQLANNIIFKYKSFCRDLNLNWPQNIESISFYVKFAGDCPEKRNVWHEKLSSFEKYTFKFMDRKNVPEQPISADLRDDFETFLNLKLQPIFDLAQKQQKNLSLERECTYQVISNTADLTDMRDEEAFNLIPLYKPKWVTFTVKKIQDLQSKRLQFANYVTIDSDAENLVLNNDVLWSPSLDQLILISGQIVVNHWPSEFKNLLLMGKSDKRITLTVTDRLPPLVRIVTVQDMPKLELVSNVSDGFFPRVLHTLSIENTEPTQWLQYAQIVKNLQIQNETTDSNVLNNLKFPKQLEHLTLNGTKFSAQALQKLIK